MGTTMAHYESGANLMEGTALEVLEPGILVQRRVVPTEVAFAALLAQTLHELTVLEAIATASVTATETSSTGAGAGADGVEVTVAASDASAHRLVPFARFLNCMTRDASWRLV